MIKFYHWIFLFTAIFLGIFGAYLLKLSQGFTKLMPTIFMIAAYLFCGWLFSLALKAIDLGLAYAIWSGLGTALVVIIGVACFNEQVTLSKAVFIVAIIVSVVGLCLTSSTH